MSIPPPESTFSIPTCMRRNHHVMLLVMKRDKQRRHGICPTANHPRSAEAKYEQHHAPLQRGMGHNDALVVFFRGGTQTHRSKSQQRKHGFAPNLPAPYQLPPPWRTIATCGSQKGDAMQFVLGQPLFLPAIKGSGRR